MAGLAITGSPALLPLSFQSPPALGQRGQGQGLWGPKALADATFSTSLSPAASSSSAAEGERYDTASGDCH
jgi:hypothetical protein